MLRQIDYLPRLAELKPKQAFFVLTTIVIAKRLYAGYKLRLLPTTYPLSLLNYINFHSVYAANLSIWQEKPCSFIIVEHLSVQKPLFYFLHLHLYVLSSGLFKPGLYHLLPFTTYQDGGFYARTNHIFNL
jgi:hypothetical protein